MQAKQAKCKNCGELRYIYAKGLCQSCYWKNMQKTSKKPKQRKGKTGEKDVFENIWEQRKHVSQLSGKPLYPKGHEFWHWQFAHLLSKGAYPSLRHDERNILLVTPKEHERLDGGDKTKLLESNNAEWVEDWIEQLKREYHS